MAEARADLFSSLVAVVQHRVKGSTSDWATMAAYDAKFIADNYAYECSIKRLSWEYRVVEVPMPDQG